MVGVLYLLALIGTAILALWLVDRYRDWTHRDRRSREEIAEAERRLKHRLLTPNWNEVVAKTKGHPSPSLVGLYQDTHTLLRRNFFVRPDDPQSDQPVEVLISTFQPADLESLEQPWSEFLPPTAFPFAVDGFGDPLFVDLSPTGADTPVRHWHHDGGETNVVAGSLGEFLSWRREDAPWVRRV